MRSLQKAQSQNPEARYHRRRQSPATESEELDDSRASGKFEGRRTCGGCGLGAALQGNTRLRPQAGRTDSCHRASARLSDRSTSFCRSAAQALVYDRTGIETRDPDLFNSCRILSARVEEGARVKEAQAESCIDYRGQGTHHSQASPAEIRRGGGFEDQAVGNQRLVGIGAGRRRPRKFDSGKSAV